MTYASVTMYASCRFVICRKQVVDHVVVTADATLMKYLRILLVYQYDVRRPKRKRQGMPVAVHRLRDILGNNSVREMALVTRHGLVARRRPTVKIIPHHMAVRARLGIIKHIRITLGIAERK